MIMKDPRALRATLEGIVGVALWAGACVWAPDEWVLAGVVSGTMLFLHAADLIEKVRNGDAGDGEQDGGDDAVEGTWTCLSVTGVTVMRVWWDPVIRHYLVDGEVWADDGHLRDFLGAMETDRGVPWVPARDGHTLAIRRGLGLPELHEEGARG